MRSKGKRSSKLLVNVYEVFSWEDVVDCVDGLWVTWSLCELEGTYVPHLNPGGIFKLFLATLIIIWSITKQAKAFTCTYTYSQICMYYPFFSTMTITLVKL